MNGKSFYRYVLVFLVSLFVLTGCGSDSGGGEFSADKVNNLVLKDQVYTIQESNITELISKSTINGAKNITVSKKLADNLKIGNIFYIPAGIDERFPLGFSGKIKKINKVKNENLELEFSEAYLTDVIKTSKQSKSPIKLNDENFLGVIAPSIVSASKSAKLQKLSGNNVKSFLDGGVTFISSKDNNQMRKSFLGEGGTVSLGTIALNLEVNLGGHNYGNEIGESSNAEVKVIVSGSLSDLELYDTHDYDLISINPYIEMDLAVRGKFNAELKLEGKSRLTLGNYSDIWDKVAKKEFDKFGISITALEGEDKIGKLPIIGLVFKSPIPVTTTSARFAVNTARSGGFIVWVYLNAKGELTLNGATGISLKTDFKMGVNKPKDGDLKSTNEINPINGSRLLEAPFIEGDATLKSELGLSLNVDVFFAGMRYINFGLDFVGKQSLSLRTDGRASYGLDKLGDEWSLSGRMCIDGQLGVGMLAKANAKFGVKAESIFKDVNINAEYKNQFPSQKNIDATTEGWINNLWYKFPPYKKCINNKVPIGEKQSITLNTINVKKQLIELKATDKDNDPLKYTIVTNPKNGKLSGVAPKLTYTPNNGYGGNDSFTFVADDGMESSKKVTVSIWIITEKTDKDKDGIPDIWELKYPNKLDMDKDDSANDYDGDGVSNYQEFLDNTDPTSVLDFVNFILEEPITTEMSVTLKWNKRGSATHYIVCISESPIGNKECKEENNIGTIITAFNNTKIIEKEYGLGSKSIPFITGKKYYTIVKAYSILTVLYQSNERVFELKEVKKDLIAPTNVTATSTTDSITLKWDKVEDVSAYKICMSESVISDGSKCVDNGGVIIGSTSTLKTIAGGLKQNTTYYFRVRGIKSGYNALWSEQKQTKLKEASLINPGTVKGSVIDAVTNKVLSANIVVSTEEGKEVKTLVTGSDGKYTLSLSEGNYIFSVKATGYISELMTVSVRHKETTIISSLRQIPNSAKGDGIAKGKIIDALSGENIDSVTLKVRKGVNSKKGTVVTTEHSDGDGAFSFDLPAGNYTVEATVDGYISIYFELLVIGKETTAKQNASMTPNIQAGEVRVILSWGTKPGDLDSHINTPSMDGSTNGYHVYWKARGRQYSAPYSKLDVDRSDFANSNAGTTSKSGPETITVYESKSGIYHYYVYNYSESGLSPARNSIKGSLVNSRATVKIYTSTGLFKSFTVPNSGTGIYWDVFTYDGGTGKVTSINTISDTKPN